MSTETLIIRVVVAGYGCDGPDLYPCKIRCTAAQYDEGEHYDVAKQSAEDAALEGTMVAIDEYDPPKKLFTLFDWDKAPVVTAEPEE